MFERMSSQNQWLNSLLFTIRYDDQICRARLLRNGTFTCESGFAAFWQDIRPVLTRLIIVTERFYEKRDKVSSPTGNVRPVKIVYGTPVFEDKQSNRRLIHVLGKLSSASLSVLHPNPYLHASVVDYVDGSNFDILIADSDGVMVIPRYRASAASLQRLCNHICDEFQEGRIIEFEPR
jgi:hypothetical protein